jgi:hypothetical protein
MSAEPPDDEDAGTDEPSSNLTRGQRFHESTGSLRDLGIAIVLLILLYVVFWAVFLR